MSPRDAIFRVYDIDFDKFFYCRLDTYAPPNSNRSLVVEPFSGLVDANRNRVFVGDYILIGGCVFLVVWDDNLWRAGLIRISEEDEVSFSDIEDIAPRRHNHINIIGSVHRGATKQWKGKYGRLATAKDAH